MPDTAKFEHAIREMHGCASSFLESVPIDEYFQGKLVWHGVVYVFSLVGHPKAQRCYAWTYTDDKGKEVHTAVLGLPPVSSPRTAVQAAIVAEFRKTDSKGFRV